MYNWMFDVYLFGLTILQNYKTDLHVVVCKTVLIFPTRLIAPKNHAII